MYENKEGFITISITPEVMLRAMTEYINTHIFREPLMVTAVDSLGYPPDRWVITCATTLQRLGGKDA